MKKAKTSIYIPNMDAETFEKICQEKGLQFVCVEVPEHGRLIDVDAAVEVKVTTKSGRCRVDITAPTIIPASGGKENE